METLAIDLIRIDGGTQPRAEIDLSLVDEYAEMNGDLPPVVTFFDGADHWLADGFHRYHGSRKRGATEIDADVRKGTLRDAILFSCGANAVHGLRRTLADKERAVLKLLEDEEWGANSSNWIAEMAVVSPQFVERVRAGVNIHTSAKMADGDSESSDGNDPKPKRRKGKDGKSYPASKSKNKVFCQSCATKISNNLSLPKNCTECKALRKKPGKAKTGDAKEGKKKPVKQTDPLKDDFGNEVPKRCRDAWADTWIQETFDLLTVLEEKFRLAKLANGLKAREKRYPFFHSKDFTDGTGFVMQYLNSLITHIKDNRPAGVCPMCEGKGCADCRSAGMVPRDLYATLKKEANK